MPKGFGRAVAKLYTERRGLVKKDGKKLRIKAYTKAKKKTANRIPETKAFRHVKLADVLAFCLRSKITQ